MRMQLKDKRGVSVWSKLSLTDGEAGLKQVVTSLRQVGGFGGRCLQVCMVDRALCWGHVGSK